MESQNSVILETCADDTMLIQTVKNIVNEESRNEMESGEGGYYVVTDVESEPHSNMEITNESTVEDQSEERLTFSYLCRVCANVNDHLIPIFEGEGLQHELHNKIHKYLPIHVSETDTLPLQLCYHCAATLLSWHELSEGCLSAERRLLEMQDSLQEKQYFNASDELEVSTQETAPEPQATESMQRSMKDEICEEETLNNADRSSSMRTPFKVLLDMQNIFWKPYKKKCQSEERKSTIGGDCDSVWIAVMDTSLDQSALMTDQLQNNDIEVKEEMSEVYKQDDYEKPKLSNQTYKTTDRSTIKNENKKIKGKCKFCPADRKNSKDTCEHVKPHKEIIETQETYQCLECGKCFKLKDSYLRHMRIHRDERPFTCHVCGKQFRDSGGLSRHIKDVHAKLKNFTCDICGKSFASKATREDHRRTHTGERPYICDSCGKTFKSKASLYIHSKLHTDEFPHPCSYCNKKFRRRQEMLAHVTTHTGEKNYGCEICSKRFRVKSELVRHKLIHSENKPFVCVQCGLAFRQKRYLNHHVKSRHDETLRTC